MTRNITFSNAGIVNGLNVLRNMETGVEIVKARKGEYWICTPENTSLGRWIVATCASLKSARRTAQREALKVRETIAAAHAAALS